MADAILSTAGIVFTLAIIAFTSFIVGMGIYGMVDHVRGARKRSRSRHQHSRSARYTAATASVARAIVKSTDHRARALLESFGAEERDDAPVRHWRCRVELAVALLYVMRGYIRAHAPRQYADGLCHILDDGVAGALYRCRPADAEDAVFDLQAKRLADYAADGEGDDLSNFHAPPARIYGMCAAAVASIAGAEQTAQRESLQRNLVELLRSAMSIEIAAAMS